MATSIFSNGIVFCRACNKAWPTQDDIADQCCSTPDYFVEVDE